MDSRELGFFRAIRQNIPRNFTEIMVYWIWVHALFGTKFLNRKHPYKDKLFSLTEVAMGHYLGGTVTYRLGLVLWLLLGILPIFAAIFVMGLI